MSFQAPPQAKDPSRVLRGRIGAYSLHSTHDPRLTTAKARATFLASFEAQVDPDGSLPPAERERRALAARRAHMARLSYRSALARRRRATRENGGAGDD